MFHDDKEAQEALTAAAALEELERWHGKFADTVARYPADEVISKIGHLGAEGGEMKDWQCLGRNLMVKRRPVALDGPFLNAMEYTIWVPIDAEGGEVMHKLQALYLASAHRGGGILGLYSDVALKDKVSDATNGGYVVRNLLLLLSRKLLGSPAFKPDGEHSSPP